MNRAKSLILLSGVIDSAVLLGWAKRRKYSVATLSFNFPGRRKSELKAVRELRKAYGSTENFQVTLPFVDPPRAEKSCYIPQRNLMYYGVAASLAEKIGARLILGGHIRHDGFVFRDAAPAFFKSLQRLIQPARSHVGKVRLHFPFIGMEKRDIIKLGVRLKVPFDLTWSCSRDVRVPCGRCGSCRERAEGFASAGVSDPLIRRK